MSFPSLPYRAAAGVLVGAVAACAAPSPSPEAPPLIVLGVTADVPLAGKIERLHIVVRNDQLAVVFEATQPFDATSPAEVTLTGLPTDIRVRVTVTAFAPGADDPLITRIVETRTEPGRSMLVPLRLNDECIPQEGERDVSCLGTTCSAGVCVLPFVSPHLLADYTLDWSQPPTGYCGPVDAGEPEVSIGWAAAPFAAHQDGDPITPQQGLQGASHFFFSVRMSNVDEASVLTHYYGTVLSSGRETSVVSVADQYVVNASGCELFMVPLILPPEDIAGEVMRLGVTVADSTGNAGHTHVDVLLTEPLPP